MHCDTCGKDDFKHVSELNRHKPNCPSNPSERGQKATEQPSAPHHLTFTNAQVQALQECLGDDYAVVLNKRVDALVKEMTFEAKPDPIIPRALLQDLVDILPINSTLGWEVHGWLDNGKNLHVELAKYKRRGR